LLTEFLLKIYAPPSRGGESLFRNIISQYKSAIKPGKSLCYLYNSVQSTITTFLFWRGVVPKLLTESGTWDALIFIIVDPPISLSIVSFLFYVCVCSVTSEDDLLSQ